MKRQRSKYMEKQSSFLTGYDFSAYPPRPDFKQLYLSNIIHDERIEEFENNVNISSTKSSLTKHVSSSSNNNNNNDNNHNSQQPCTCYNDKCIERQSL
jgi:hypothetical protein